MVILNRIYTRTGDGGETALSDGTRVAKHSLRVAAYGTVDETNATLGLARLHAAAASTDTMAAALAMASGSSSTITGRTLAFTSSPDLFFTTHGTCRPVLSERRTKA